MFFAHSLVPFFFFFFLAFLFFFNFFFDLLVMMIVIEFLAGASVSKRAMEGEELQTMVGVEKPCSLVVGFRAKSSP